MIEEEAAIAITAERLMDTVNIPMKALSWVTGPIIMLE